MAISGGPRAGTWFRPRAAALLAGVLALGSVACGAAQPWQAHWPLGVSEVAVTRQGESPVPAAAVMATEPAERFEAALLERVNADRAARGLRPLALDPELVAPARTRAAAQAAGEALSHAEPGGTAAGAGVGGAGSAGSGPAFQRLLKEVGVRYGVAGENLARPRVAATAGAGETAAAAHGALMASETHRQNILDPAYDRMAVGMMRGADGRIVYAQLFRGA